MANKAIKIYPTAENAEFIAAHANGRPTAFINAALDFYHAALAKRDPLIEAVAGITQAIRALEAKWSNDERKP